MIRRSAASWIVGGSLAVLGALIAGFGAFGAASVLALAYYGFCLTRPEAGLAWAFVALPVTIPQFQIAQIDIQPFELFVWPVCLIALGSTLQRPRGPRVHNLTGFAPLLVMGGYFVLTAVILWGDRTPLEVRMWGGALAFATACYLKADSDEFRTHLWRALTTSAVLLGILALSQELFGVPLFRGVAEPRDLIRLVVFGDTHPVRLANLTFQHFNAAGAYLTILVPTLYAGAVTRRTRGLWIGLTAAVIALYLTYSRGAALSSLIAVLIVTALVRTDRRERVALVIGAVVAVVAIIWFALPVVLRSEYLGTLSLGVRALIWQAYLQAWLASPVIGLGPGNGFAAAQFLSPYGEEYGAHNNYLYIAADFGVLGLGMLAFGLGAVILRTIRLNPATRATRPLTVGATAAVVALVFHSFFDHSLVVFAYRVALLGLVAAASNGAPREPLPP